VNNDASLNEHEACLSFPNVKGVIMPAISCYEEPCAGFNWRGGDVLVEAACATAAGRLQTATVRVSDRTRLQKLFISVNTPFTRGFWAKIPVYESCAVGAFLGGFGQLWAILGFSGLLLHKYAVYEGFLAIKYSFYAVGAPVP